MCRICTLHVSARAYYTIVFALNTNFNWLNVTQSLRVLNAECVLFVCIASPHNQYFTTLLERVLVLRVCAYSTALLD